MGGGGGSAGAVQFPDYLQDTHHYLLHGTPDGGAFDVPSTHLVEILDTAWNTNEPYSGFSFTDPATELAAIEARWDDLETLVTGLDHETDWAAILTQARAGVDQALFDISTAALQAYAPDMAESVVEEAYSIVSAALASEDPAADWESFVDSVVTKLAEAGVITEIDADDILDYARAGAASELSMAIAASESALDQNADWEELVDTVNSKLADYLTVRADLDISTLLTDADTAAQAQIADAIQAAADILAGTDLDDIIAAFTARQDAAHATAIRRFASRMADYDAVHSSAFVLGLALIENQHLIEIAGFQGQLELDTYRSVVTGYLQNVQAAVLAQVQVASVNSEARDRFFANGIQSMVNMLVNKTQFEQGLAGLHVEAFRQEGAVRAQLAGENKRSRDALLAQGIQGISGLRGNREELQRTLLQMYQQSFLGNLETSLRAELANKQSRDQMIAQATSQMVQMLYNNAELNRATTALRSEIGRQNIVATREYEQGELDLDVRFALWELDTLLKGSNVLASLTGSGAAIPDKPSPFSSALGGTLSGAATGAAIGSVVPGVGTAIGAGVGAGLGLLGGLFS